MKKIRMIVLGVMTCGLVAATAWAGAKYNNSLYINPTSMFASGQFADTRASGDSGAVFYCATVVNSSSNYMFCYGVTSTANFYCANATAPFITAAQSIQSDSSIYVNWNSSGICTSLTVYNGSPWSPKAP